MSPLERMYSLDVAADLLNFPSREALAVWLYRRPTLFPRYYRFGRRLIPHSQCVLIREMTVKSSRWAHTRKATQKPTQ